MEQPQINSEPTNWFLSLMAFFFKLLCALTIGQVYDCIFGILSLASLALLIIINYPKAKAALKRKTIDNE